jgi:serine/threonine protein kinase
MSQIRTEPIDDDPRLVTAAREYLAELEIGRVPDRQAYLARYPELAIELAECLEGMELAHALRPASAVPTPESQATPLGDFQIVREIGRGGMGVVYEAMQLSLGRRVALKVLPFAAALDTKQLQRFKTEAHAAAQLHHTNIVPVHAIGCERGVHFYAMQLIEGRPLDRVIGELREGGLYPDAPLDATGGAATVEFRASSTAGNVSRRTLRPRESYRTAASIAAHVADALAYAHEAGVIHRDIKPANLLLDGKGGVWVTDFGLAQVSADANLTQTGNVVGTLRYMSPEQALGRRDQIDHRTDVYSLGATLYELLTLEPVFGGNDRQALLHQIVNDEPKPLRSLDRGVSVELETIVLKALAKLPGDRYATAGDMAADLRRFLDDRTILARRPSLVDRVRKWGRRHPSVVGAAIILLVCGFIGLSVSCALIAREQARTQTALDSERRQKEEAEKRFLQARRAADDMIQMAEDELADAPHLSSLRKRLLESSLAYYQEFIEQRQDDPDAQAELQATRDRVKRILRDLAALQGAGQIFLLKDNGVLDDLKADADQRERLAELTKRLDDQRAESFREFHKLGADERKKRFLGMARDNDAAVADILTKQQQRRLRQISLQSQGTMAFRDAEVAAALKLTSEQKEKLRGIEGEMFMMFMPKPGQPRSPGHPGGPPGHRGHDERRKAAIARVEAMLTPAQMKQWRLLAGEPFAGSMPSFGPPPGPFPPR